MTPGLNNADIAGRPDGLVEAHLPNGANIVVLPTTGSASPTPVGGVVALQAWVLSGTAAESAGEHGGAHLLEHMLFKPIRMPGRKAPTDLASEIEALGGDVNAFTSHDETVFHATVPAVATQAAIDVLLASVVSPQIDAAALQREAEVVVEEILQYRDDPGSRLLQDVTSKLYGDHAYGRPVLGTRADVRGFTAKGLARFHARAYAADRVQFVVVGAVDPTAVIRRSRRWLKRLPKGGRRPAERPTRPRTQPAVLLRRDDVTEAHLELAWAAPALPDPVGVALEVAAIVLGYGEAARLSVETRRGTKSVSDVHASFYGSRLGSTFSITARMRGRQALAACSAVLEQVQRLREVPLEPEELARARAVLRSDLVYRRETTQGQAHALGYYLSLVGDLDADRRYYNALSGLTADDVMSACAAWLKPSAAVLGLVVPESDVSVSEASGLRRIVSRQLRPAKATRRGRGSAIRRKAGVSWVDLPCGVRVRAVVDSRVPIAAGWLVWPGGLRLERPRTHGVTPVMAELLTRGCDAIDGDALAREIDGKAAVLDGFSGRNSAGVHLECLAPDLPVVLTRALQCVLAPTFSADELDEERRVALADYEAEDDDLAKLAVRDALSRLYVGHPYRLRRRGVPQSLARLTATGLRRAWRDGYPVPRMVLGLAGDVDLEAAAALVESMVSKSAEGPVAPHPRWPLGLRESQRCPRASERRIVRPKEQAHIALAYPGLSLGHRMSPAVEVLMAVLGGQAGRLFTRLREDEGLVYHVGASASEGLDAGDIVVYAATGQDKVQRARAAMESELDRVARSLISPDELARAKAWLIGQYDAAMERRGRTASLVAFDEAFGLPLGTCFQFRTRIERVSARAVLSAAAQLLPASRQIASVVSADG